MSVDYDHSRNQHSLKGPEAALAILFDTSKPASLLDVGCGTGTWLRAAQKLGTVDVFGVDGINISDEDLLVPKSSFLLHDLTQPLKLGRRFELALCLEVAEHLEAEAGKVLIHSLMDHADTVLFSAACPGQPGQHHVNCQWPLYWQELFNTYGFTCEDTVRWRIWSDSRIEPWYRQNMFVAKRNPSKAGTEPRILSVIHPELLPCLEGAIRQNVSKTQLRQIEQGCLRIGWYFKATALMGWAKLRRRIG